MCWLRSTRTIYSTRPIDYTSSATKEAGKHGRSKLGLGKVSFSDAGKVGRWFCAEAGNSVETLSDQKTFAAYSTQAFAYDQWIWSFTDFSRSYVNTNVTDRPTVKLCQDYFDSAQRYDWKGLF